jgi:short-subunit dehydrogenase
LHGIIERIPQTHRYRVTDTGWRTALFCTRCYNRILRPGLASIIPEEAVDNSPLRRRFDELDIDVESREVNLNVLALVRLTHAAAGGMKQRGHGGILNVSSLAGYQPGPLNATYSASKAFVTSFTQAVHEELKGTGVAVTALCPSFTHTEFQERAGAPANDVPGFMWQEAPEVARAGLDGLARNRAIAIPGAINKTLGAFSDIAPTALTRRISALILKRASV